MSEKSKTIHIGAQSLLVGSNNGGDGTVGGPGGGSGSAKGDTKSPGHPDSIATGTDAIARPPATERGKGKTFQKGRKAPAPGKAKR